MRIRVDTDDLQAKAKDYQSAADTFGQAGDDILNVALSLPSYDGQLSGPARAAGYEIQRQSREIKTGLASDAQSLAKTAQDYEAEDSQAIDAFGASQASLAAYAPEYALLGTESDGGSSSNEDKDYPHPPYDRIVAGSDIAYEYQPENKTIIIIYKGKFYSILFDPNDPSFPPEPYRGIIEKVIHCCDDIDIATTNFDGDLFFTGFGLIPGVGDVAEAVSILWQSLRDKSVDLWDLGTGSIIKGVEMIIKAEGKNELAEIVSPLLGTIAAIPTLRCDFNALVKAYDEMPSLNDIHKLCDPNNGVVISVKDDLYDHNGFSPAPEPQDQTPTQTPTPTTKPTNGTTQTPQTTQTQTPTPVPTQTPAPLSK